MTIKQAIFRAGTSGIVLAEPNKQAFPEEHRQKSRLAYYATLFNTLEVNSSFYKPPMASTLTKWSHIVPADFQFTLKLWRGITHSRALDFLPGNVDQFMKAAQCIGRQKGCLLVQLPPSVTFAKIEKLEALLERIQLGNPLPAWRVAVEFRHRSWYNASTSDILERYRTAIVCHDMPSSGTMTPCRHSDFIYIRFHGIRGDYKGSYTTVLLEEYAGRIKGWLQEGKEVYAYFNNTIGEAAANLRTLIQMVHPAYA